MSTEIELEELRSALANANHVNDQLRERIQAVMQERDRRDALNFEGMKRLVRDRDNWRERAEIELEKGKH